MVRSRAVIGAPLSLPRWMVGGWGRDRRRAIHVPRIGAGGRRARHALLDESEDLVRLVALGSCRRRGSEGEQRGCRRGHPKSHRRVMINWGARFSLYGRDGLPT